MSSSDDRNAPMIGEFSGPTDNAPRVGLRRKRNTETEKVVEVKEETETSLKTEEEIPQDKPKTAEELEREFLDGLARVNITPEKARSIMDDVLQKRYYLETHKIRSVEIVLRSRGYMDTLRTQRYLEVENPTYAVNMDEIVMRYNSAASLLRYGDISFDHPEDRDESTQKEIEDAFEIRRRFVERMPSVLVGKLHTLVFNMDVKLSAVFAEGAPADF